MLLNLLSGSPFREVGIGEASLYALIGFSMVFLGISFLIFIVWATGKIISVVEKKTTVQDKKTKNSKAKDVSLAQQASEMQPSVQADEISDETVAVITAAIMAYYQKNNPKCEFTVKRIKRI